MLTICFNDIYNQDINTQWSRKPFKGFCMDSRIIEKDQIFLSLNSFKSTVGQKEFAQNALDNGALAVISENMLGLENEWVCSNVAYLMGDWQKNYLNFIDHVPSLNKRPCIVGVTGTNGKTTVSRLVAQLIDHQGERCAVLGTTGNGFLPNLEPSLLTTLCSVELQNTLHAFFKQGVKYISLEASSHGIHQGRLHGVDIEIGIFTNLTIDHLDYHGTFEEYANVKASYFRDFTTLKTVIINLDDEYSSLILEAAKNNISKPKILTYSSTSPTADYYGTDLNLNINGTSFIFNTPTGIYLVNSPLIGKFNIENLMASLIAAEYCGFNLMDLIPSVPKLETAPGRMQMIKDNNRLFVVDFAHTPDALSKVLSTLKQLLSNNHKLWAVFGCGGDRDKTKRPLMTMAALYHADQVIITSDNPRSESIEQILLDMKLGIDFSKFNSKLLEIHNRRDAIQHSVENTKEGDIVVIAGKGHEKYQEINGVRYEFEEVIEINNALKCK